YGSLKVKIDEKSGALATYDFQTITGVYRNLEIYWKLRDNSAGTGVSFATMTFNNDTGANYNDENFVVAGNAATAPDESIGRANLRAMIECGGGQGAGQYSEGTTTVYSYSDTNSRKSFISQIAQDGGDAGSGTATRLNSGRWKTSN